MVAVLSHLFGLHQLQMAEDVVQEAFLKAHQVWRFNNLPADPSAWLMQVAKNKAVDILRRETNFRKYTKKHITEPGQADVNEYFHEQEVADNQLRMIFACCHPALKQDDQVALTLKIVSGFSMQEIARSLLTNEAAIQKRLHRARELLKTNGIKLEMPAGHELKRRLSAVHTVLYLLFNEGYNSITADELIRRDLCAEAMRCGKLLTEHKVVQQPSSFALLSLMCFHAARFDSRVDKEDNIILLPRQDRDRWDKELIAVGIAYLNKSSEGDELSIYHIESAIAAEHCLARSFEATNWPRLLKLYDFLYEANPTPVVQLNRAVVLAETGAVESAIQAIMSIPGIEKWIRSDYIFSAVLGDLYKRLSDIVKAREYLEHAHGLTSSHLEKRLMRKKIVEMGLKK